MTSKPRAEPGTSQRARNAAQTSAAILAAARVKFAADGFERTTIRAVAAAAGVDPALVMHYFGSKDGLFTAAAQLELTVPDLREVTPERAADVILPTFLAAWAPDGPFLGLLRAATTTPVAAQALRDVFARQVLPVITAAVPDHPADRAALIGALLIGLALGRHILGVPALAQMSEDDLVSWLRPVIARYLTAPVPVPAEKSPQHDSRRS